MALVFWKNSSSIALVAALLSGAAAQAQVVINSKQVRVSHYVYPTGAGKWGVYDAIGFAQPISAGGAGVKPKMFLMPSLTVPVGGVKFVDNNGNDYVPTNCTTKPARTITFSVRSAAALPTEVQKVAVGAALTGTNVEAYRVPWPVDAAGNPTMWTGVAGQPGIVAAVNQAYALDRLEVDKQRNYATQYDAYDTSIATLNKLSLDLIIDNEVVATQSFAGSLVAANTATVSLSLLRPDTYTCNRIASGNYSIVARYRFNDNHSATINARFDVKQSLRHFVEETQKATTKSSSSGWKIMGIGSRRSKMKTSLETSMTVDGEQIVIENTTVVMNDANDSMIQEFESVFFPQLTKEETIANHIAAAAAATTAGNTALAKAHSDYAASLTNGSEQLETDAVGAAAALNKEDYATFIAKGVRASNNNDSRTDNFRRTVDINVSSTQIQEWNQARSVTKERETSTPVVAATKQRFGPILGIQGGAPFTYLSLQPMVGLQPRSGFIVGGLQPTGPMATAGIQTGMVIMRINGDTIQSLADVGTAIQYLEPGQQVQVEALEKTGGWLNPITPVWGTNSYYTVTVGSYPLPVDADQ